MEGGYISRIRIYQDPGLKHPLQAHKKQSGNSKVG